MKRLVLLLMVLIGTVCAAPNMEAELKAREAFKLFTEAKNKAEKDPPDYKGAVESLEKALKLAPNHIDSWLYKGIFHREMREFDKAQEAFERVVKLNRRDHRGYTQLVDTFVKQKKFDDARKVVKQMMELDQNSFLAWYALGVLAYQQGRLDEAITVWNRASQLYSDYPPTRFNLGWAYYQKRDYQQATVHITAASNLDPTRDLYHFGFGWVSFANGRNAVGLSALERAKMTGKSGPIGQAVRALEALNGKRYDDALRLGEEVTTKRPEFCKGWLILARARHFKGDLAGAHQAADKAMEVDPNDFEAKALKAALPPPPPPSPTPSPSPSVSPSPSASPGGAPQG